MNQPLRTVMSLQQLLAKLFNKEQLEKIPTVIISLDPGETTGYAIWHRTEWFPEGKDYIGPRTLAAVHKLIKCGQINTKTIRLAIEEEESIENLLTADKPDLVVLEDYRIYGWKTDEHAWSSVHTIQLIGCIKTYCIQNNIPFVIQSAQVAKQFCTDDKLEQWGYWEKGMRHARDAIRHGAYYLIHGSQKEYDEEGYVKK